jgi:hypothetical protein
MERYARSAGGADGAEAAANMEKVDLAEAKLKELESRATGGESLKGGVERAWTDFKKQRSRKLPEVKEVSTSSVRIPGTERCCSSPVS